MLCTFKLGPKDVERISEVPNEPHHHEFEELIIGAAGTLEASRSSMLLRVAVTR